MTDFIRSNGTWPTSNHFEQEQSLQASLLLGKVKINFDWEQFFFFLVISVFWWCFTQYGAWFYPPANSQLFPLSFSLSLCLARLEEGWVFITPKSHCHRWSKLKQAVLSPSPVVGCSIWNHPRHGATECAVCPKTVKHISLGTVTTVDEH